MKNIVAIKYVSILLLLRACSNDNRTNFEIYTKGNEVYENKCIACHNTANLTTYKPTLYEMHKLDSSIITKIIKQAVKDSNHIQRTKHITDDEVNSLIFYIRNYKIITG